MVDCRSKHIRVSNERRKDPRLEFQCIPSDLCGGFIGS